MGKTIKRVKEVNEQVERFNKQFPEGSKVRWRSVGREGVEYKEYTVAYAALNQGDQAVAWFKEKSGCVCISEHFVDFNMENYDGN